MRSYIVGSAEAVPLFPRMPWSNVPYADLVNLKAMIYGEVQYLWDMRFEYEFTLSNSNVDSLYSSVGVKLFGTRENFEEYLNFIEAQDNLVSEETQATVDILVREYLGLEAVEIEPVEEETNPVVEEPEPVPEPTPEPVTEPEPVPEPKIEAIKVLFPLTTINEEDEAEYWRIAGIMTGGFTDRYAQDLAGGIEASYFLSDRLLLEELQVLTFTHDGFYFIIKLTPAD